MAIPLLSVVPAGAPPVASAVMVELPPDGTSVTALLATAWLDESSRVTVTVEAPPHQRPHRMGGWPPPLTWTADCAHGLRLSFPGLPRRRCRTRIHEETLRVDVRGRGRVLVLTDIKNAFVRQVALRISAP